MSDSHTLVYLPSKLIRDLYESYLRLSEACNSIEKAVTADHSNGYPVYVPTFGKSKSDCASYRARLAAIDSMTQLFIRREDYLPPGAGIVCASPETVATIDALNTAKTNFKAAVMAVRNFQRSANTSASRLTRLINNELLEKGYRNAALKKAMSTASINALDLKRCYAQIRIMPSNLDVFSWTWATKHSRIKKLTVEEAVAMARKLPRQETADAGVDIIRRQCRTGEILLRKIELPNQLGANYAYLSDAGMILKSSPISGIVIAQQQSMPRKLWRDNPRLLVMPLPRLPRESKIETKPLFKALGLYRYAV